MFHVSILCKFSSYRWYRYTHPTDRWEYLHSSIHSVGALLNSKLWSNREQDWSNLLTNGEIKGDWMEALEQFFPGDVQSQMNANAGLRKFWNKEGIFARAVVTAEARSIDPKDFWKEHGWEHPELQIMGMKVSAQPTAMTSAERNWKVGMCNRL